MGSKASGKGDFPLRVSYNGSIEGGFHVSGKID